jgi:hypothetical protein
MPLPQSIVERVSKDFPLGDQDEVLEILSFYGTETYEREQERVLLAILNLSKGSMEAVWEYVDRAKRDYRDVLFWSEHPEESRLDTPEKIAQFNNMCRWLGIDLEIDLDSKHK